MYFNTMSIHEPVGAPIVVKTSLDNLFKVFRVKPVSQSEDKVFYLDNRERPLDVTQVLDTDSLVELQLGSNEKITGWTYV